MNKNYIEIQQELNGLANSVNLKLSWKQENDDDAGNLIFEFEPATDSAITTGIAVVCVGREDAISHLHDLATKFHQAADALTVG